MPHGSFSARSGPSSAVDKLGPTSNVGFDDVALSPVLNFSPPRSLQLQTHA